MSTGAKVKFRVGPKDLLDLNPTDGSNRIEYSAPRMSLSKAFDLVRSDAISHGFTPVSKSSPPIPAAKPNLTAKQQAALTSAVAAIDAAISEPDPLVLIPQVPKPILPMPKLPKSAPPILADSVSISSASGVSCDAVSDGKEIEFLMSVITRRESFSLTNSLRSFTSGVSQVIGEIGELFRDLKDGFSQMFNSSEDEFGTIRKPNYLGMGLTATFSSIVAIGALLVALNPFGQKPDSSQFIASISSQNTTNFSMVSQPTPPAPVVSTTEVTRQVAFVPAQVDMDFTSVVVSHSVRPRSRSVSTSTSVSTPSPSTSLVKVESLGSSPSVSVALSSKQFGRSRLFVGEVVGDSSVSSGSSVAGPSLIINRTLARMGLSMSDLPSSVASLISENTPKSLTNFATLVEADAFRLVSPNLEEKEDIWMTRASLNADQFRQYARVLGATGLFN